MQSLYKAYHDGYTHIYASPFPMGLAQILSSIFLGNTSSDNTLTLGVGLAERASKAVLATPFALTQARLLKLHLVPALCYQSSKTGHDLHKCTYLINLSTVIDSPRQPSSSVSHDEHMYWDGHSLQEDHPRVDTVSVWEGHLRGWAQTVWEYPQRMGNPFLIFSCRLLTFT